MKKQTVIGGSMNISDKVYKVEKRFQEGVFVKKLVSVIVPAYNVEKYLNRCMESICNQTYSKLEIILINDGSADSTPELCDWWAKKDERVVVIHQRNSGQCVARNAALDVMKGEYVMFVDSDDYINRDMISQMVSFIEKNNLDFARSGYMNVKSNESAELIDCEDTGKERIFNQKQIIENFLTAPYSRRKCFTAIMCATLYKASLFKNVRFPEGFIYEEGFVLPDIYLASDSAGYIDRTFYYYRENEDGTMATNKLTDKSLKSIDDWQGIHYKFKEKYPEFNKITCDRWVKGYLSKLFVLTEKEGIDRDDFYKKKIINTLIDECDYFVKMNVDKEYLKEIEMLSDSVEKWREYKLKMNKKSGNFFTRIISKMFG